MSLNSRHGLLVIIAAAVIWFAMLGYRDLLEPDEGRYAEIPREMVATGDWLTPRINGFKYFEKPPLQYWITAATYRLFGQSNTSARLWLAVSSFACALFVGYLGHRLFGRDTGYYAPVMLLSSTLYVVLGHLLTLDMSLAVFMTVGIGSLTLAQTQRDRASHVRNWMLLGWAALAAALLTKGLIGIVLPGLAVLLYMLWQRDWAIMKHLHIGKGLLLLFAIAAPWFVAVSMANEEFAHFFFIREHFERYTSTVHEREGPLYYFILVFLLGISPWLTSSLSSLFKPGFSWRPAANTGFDVERFLWVFVVTVFVFFSLGKSKLPAYILPIFPFVALLAAKRLAEDGRVIWDQWVMSGLAVASLVLGIIITRFATETIPVELYENSRPWIFACVAILSVGTLSMFKWAGQPGIAIATGGLCAMLGCQLLLWGFQNIAESRSSAGIARAITASVNQEVPVYAYGSYPHSLPFYLRRTIALALFRGELAMGIDSEPDKWISSPGEFVRRWQNETQAVAVMRFSNYSQLVKLGVPMRVIYEGPRRIAVVRQ